MAAANSAALRAVRHTPTPAPRDDLAAKLRVIGDPTRMAILEELGTDECCVCDLAEALGVTQPLLSHHLRQLRDAGLIRDRKDGRWTYYRIETSAVDALLSSVHALICQSGSRHRICKD
jgi:ArsR family transcriptional regulator